MKSVEKISENPFVEIVEISQLRALFIIVGTYYRVFGNEVPYFGSLECQQNLSMGLDKGYVHVL